MREEIVFQIYHNQELEFRVEEGLSLLFGLNGCNQISTGIENYELERAGLLLINPMGIYQLTCPENSALLHLHMGRSVLQTVGWDRNKHCYCYAQNNNGEEESYRRIRQYLAEIFQEYLQNHSLSLDYHSPLLKMLRCLQRDFSGNYGMQLQREQTVQRMKHILDYIHEHWWEDLSLSGVAEQEYLSSSYLSRFFQKNLNVSFSKYIKRLRLIHASRMLIQTEESVTRIAYDCGFKTPSAFIEAFKQLYQKTPKQFRDVRHQLQREQTVGLPQERMRSDVSALLEYSPKKSHEPSMQEISLQLDCTQGKGRKIKWRRMLNIGYARDGLSAPVQEQIRRAQEEIGYEYIRFHGILDSDMHVYWEDENGKPYFHFTYVNMLFDFILSLGLKPYVELSFMPSQLAREQTRIFDRSSVFSGCIALDKWRNLIRAVVQNFIDRYGREEVLQWRFTTISRSYMHLGCILPEDYDALYENCYRGVKSVDSELSFGGPGCFAYLIQEANGFSQFFDLARERDCIPDFITMQCHPHDQSAEDGLFMSYTYNQQSAPAVLSDDDDFLLHSMQKLKALLKEYGMEDKEIFIEECTSTLWQRDLSGDTCYKASWLAKNVCDNEDMAVFGYWLLTDFMEERARLESVYHGGYGMFTYNGIPKASYYSMVLLGQLGNEIVAKGENWMLTRKGEEYQMILFNCSRYSSIYRYRYQRLENPEDAYSVFEQGEKLHFRFCLEHLPEGNYLIEQTKISREQGSSFDQWLELGAPPCPDVKSVAYLKKYSHPMNTVKRREAQNGLHFSLEMAPMDTMLIKISPEKQGNIR